MIFIGIDLGTSSVKTIALNQEGQVIGEVSKDYPVHYYNENWAEQNPEDWWQETLAALKELIQISEFDPNEIRSIGFSGQMHGLVALDQNGDILIPSILWCDQRTEVECDEITTYFGEKRLASLVGNKALTGFTAPKILWMKKHQPDLFGQVAKILLPKDYVRYRLTGEFATDYSDASGMLLLDVENKCWSKEMLDYIGIRESQLPALHESYQVTGTLSEALKNELDIQSDVLVVGGAGDQAAGAIGTGTVSDGIISVTLGTSGVVFAAHDSYFVDPACRLHAFCHANGKYHSMGVMLSAASCLQWWVDQVHPEVGFDQLLKEAEAEDSNLIFLPYLIGERTPYADPHARGGFIGLNMNSNRGQMTRAILEGVSFGLKDSLDILEDMGVSIKEIRVTGGGSRSPLWKQIIADIFNMPVSEINTHQGGALGAAILAGVGAGHYGSIEEATGQIIQLTATTQPNRERVVDYRHKHQLYQRLYQDLKDYYQVAAK